MKSGPAYLLYELMDEILDDYFPALEALDARIDHIEAVPIHFHEDDSYSDYDRGYPTNRNLCKNEIIREWKDAMLPLRVVMTGDGISDLETKPDVDLFIGFGGVVARPPVRDGCDCWLTDMHETAVISNVLEGEPIGPRDA